MGRNKNRDRTPPDKRGDSSTDKPASDQPATDSPGVPPASDQLAASGWSERKRPAWRAFPGPRMLKVALRVAVERIAYAELIAHAKETLDSEVCGVLVGEVYEDDEGAFVHIKDIIRGAAAEQASTHVTYTQETWNLIHETMEKRFPKSQIVGWYHSHPGYGVEFSEMDQFIQKNFFSGATQVGLVLDPLSGEVGLCMNANGEINYINRFWVEGREQRAAVPGSRAGGATPSDPATGGLQDRLEAVEVRLEQTIRAFDEMRTTIYRFVLTVGMIVGVGVVFVIGYTIYSNYAKTAGPPALHSYAQLPLKVGDKVILLGVEVVGWQIASEARPQETEKPEQPPANRQPETTNQSAASAPAPGTNDSASPPAANRNASAPPNTNQGRP